MKKRKEAVFSYKASRGHSNELTGGESEALGRGGVREQCQPNGSVKKGTARYASPVTPGGRAWGSGGGGQTEVGDDLVQEERIRRPGETVFL